MKSSYEKRTGHSRSRSRKNDGAPAIARRQVALNNLIQQLESGKHNTRDGVKELTDEDKVRINGEIESLKKRLR